MKKKVLAMMMVAALGVAGFAGCGDKASGEANAPESNVEQDAGAADAGAADAGAADAGAEDAGAADAGAEDAGAADAGAEDTDAGAADAGATVEEWYNSQIDAIHEIEDQFNAAADGFTVSVTVDGNALVFLYKLTEEFPTDEESLAALAETYDSMFETQKSVFESLCSQIKSETGVEDAVIRIAVANPDDTELYSRDFSN